MMIVMKPTATEEQVQAVIARIESCGARAHPSRGEEVTVIGAIGDREHVARLGLDAAMSHSCYAPLPDGSHCGLCDACRLRSKGFAEAGLLDPTRYAMVAGGD